jgi:hypothetical protein
MSTVFWYSISVYSYQRYPSPQDFLHGHLDDLSDGHVGNDYVARRESKAVAGADQLRLSPIRFVACRQKGQYE